MTTFSDHLRRFDLPHVNNTSSNHTVTFLRVRTMRDPSDVVCSICVRRVWSLDLSGSLKYSPIAPICCYKHNVMCREQSDHYSDVIVRSLMTSNDIMMSISCDILNTKQGHDITLWRIVQWQALVCSSDQWYRISSSRPTLASIQIWSRREDSGCEVYCGHNDVAIFNLVLSFFYFFKNITGISFKQISN